jgi:hypothetical protein
MARLNKEGALASSFLFIRFEWLVLLGLSLSFLLMVQPFFLLGGLHPFDHQRSIEIVFLSISFLFLVPFISLRKVPFLFWVMGALSMLSAFLGSAGVAGWAQETRFLLWAVLLLIFPFSWAFVATQNKKIISVIFFVGLSLYFIYVIFGTYLLLGQGVVDPAFVISGFANINHAAGFLVLGFFMLPGIESCLSDYRRVVLPFSTLVGGGLFLFVLIIMARGSFLSGLAVAMFLVFFCKGRARKKYSMRLLMYAAIGTALYFLFYFDSSFLRVEENYIASLYRDTGRIALFREGIQGWFESPLLGNGPLSFSQLSSVPEAHPHNILIASLYEYGALVTIIAVYLLIKAATVYLRAGYVADQSMLHIVGGSTIVCFLSYAQVSGLTMIAPSMLLLALAVGFAFENVVSERPRPDFLTNFSGKRAVGAFMIVLAFFSSSIFYYQVSTENISGAPRFWLQGKL